MDTIIPAVSPLRQRMTEDMRMRKLEPRTQEAYIRAVRKLAAYLHRPPDTASVEDLRNFQLHLVDSGTSPVTLNATLTGLRFFFDDDGARGCKQRSGLGSGTGCGSKHRGVGGVHGRHTDGNDRDPGVHRGIAQYRHDGNRGALQ